MALGGAVLRVRRGEEEGGREGELSSLSLSLSSLFSPSPPRPRPRLSLFPNFIINARRHRSPPLFSFLTEGPFDVERTNHARSNREGEPSTAAPPSPPVANAPIHARAQLGLPPERGTTPSQAAAIPHGVSALVEGRWKSPRSMRPKNRLQQRGALSPSALSSRARAARSLCSERRARAR
jgi:hypothetical protein